MTEEVKRYIHQVALPMKVLFKDMAKYAPSKLFGLLGNAVIIPVYTNLLSPAQYGIYVISLAVLSFLCILFSDWIGLSGLRFFRKNELCDKIPNYLSTLIMILCSNLFVMYILAFVFRYRFYDYFNVPPKIFLIILLLIIPVAIRALLFQVLRAQIKPGAFTVSTIVNQILTIAFSVLIIKYLHFGAVSVLIGMAVSISIIDIILVFQSNILKYLQFEMPDSVMVKSIFLYGIPVAIASISMWAINQSNKFITGHYYGMKNAGLVGVAYNMTFPILMTLFAIITIAAFPRIINLYEEKIDVKPIISKLTGYYMLISLPLVLLMSVYAKDIIMIFANEKYIEAYTLLPYLAFSTFFLSFTDYTTMQYHLANKTYILTALKVVSGLLGLALNFFLIKTMGLIGAGVAALISNFIYFILSVIVVVPGLEWRIPYKRIAHILFSFIPAFFVWYFIHKSFILPVYQMIILLLVYYSFFFSVRKMFREIMI
ncbi:MAG: oligosaccharide flippase family protein [Clostridium sp.]|nr:oligosaccharide flippase family protein [Clostridium sp.]